MIRVNFSSRTVNDEHKAVEILHEFTKAFCIDVEKEDLTFRCKECPFENHSNGTCAVKKFKRVYAPDFKNFGAIGDL